MRHENHLDAAIKHLRDVRHAPIVFGSPEVVLRHHGDMTHAAISSARLGSHLIFRSAQGSLTFGGWWMTGVGVFILGMTLFNTVWAMQHPSVRARFGPTFVFVAQIAFSVAVGTFFIVAPHLATPGKLY